MNRAVLAAVATLLIGAGAALGQEWPVPFGTLPELEDVPLLGKALDAEPPELPNGLHVWGGVEELLWWEKKQPLPSNLVTTGLASDVRPGALGQPNTLVVFGPNEIGYGAFSGVRLFAGAWLDRCQFLGVDVSGFVLEDRGRFLDFNSTAGGNPLLALRRLDPPTGIRDAFLISTPSLTRAGAGPFAGGIALSTDSQFWGVEGNLLHRLYCAPNCRLVALVGLRYLGLDENVSVLTRKGGLGSSRVNFVGGSFDAGAVDLTEDRFHSRNDFFGGQVGLRGEYFCGRFFVGASGTLAMGRTDEVANVLGISTLVQRRGPAVIVPGGLYALHSNSGRFTNQDFGVVPEFQLKGGVILTPWLRVTLGYNFLYWSRVLRAGKEIDVTVDPRQVPTDPGHGGGIGASFPRPALRPTDFWAQGLTFGMEVTF